MLVSTGHSKSVADKLKTLESEKETVISRIANVGFQKSSLGIKEIFTEAVNELDSYLEQDKQKAHSLMKGLFDEIELEDIDGAIVAKVDKTKVLELVLKQNCDNGVSKRGCEGRI